MSETNILDQILASLQEMNGKIDRFINMRSLPLHNGSFLDATALMELPDHLRKSCLVVLAKGLVTAGDVASQTKRARAVESGYLNTLCTMGYLNKQRKGRETFFFLSGVK